MADYSRNWQEILRRYRVYVAVEKRLAENTVEAYMRDVERLEDCRKRMNLSPIDCCALAGTTYPVDRNFEAEKLGFDGICRNSRRAK